MTRSWSISWVLVAFAVVLIIEFVAVSALSAAPGPGTDAAALLTVITAGAVAIERLLEGLWSTVGLFGASDWWPLNVLSQDVQKLAKQLNTGLGPFFADATAEINKFGLVGNKLTAEAAAAKTTVDDLQAQLLQLSTTKLSNARLQAIIVAANQAVTALQAKYPAIEASGALASTVIADFSSAVDYLKDNPGRKVISLFLGMVLGMIVAGLFSLDLVRATLGAAAATYTVVGIKLKYVTVALTGLAIGLGSNPLHEIISTLQQIKTGKKIANS